MVDYRLEIKVGPKVLFRLKVANRDSAHRQFSFSSSQEYDFVVEKGGICIWRWSADKAFAQMLHQRTLSGGQISKPYQAEWNRRDAGNQPVGPGTFTVKAFFLGIKKNQPVAVKDFELK